MDRRAFIKATAVGAMATQLMPAASLAADTKTSLIPARLKAGDKVAAIAPASAIFDPVELEIAKESFEAMGLEVVPGKHVLDRHGYLAGRDEDRAADINAAFADPDIKGVFALRGGWGCNRVLPYLDFDSIGKHPKVLLGYSDITALLNSIYKHTGMVSFHGPVGMSYWGAFQADQLRKVVFEGQQTTMQNYPEDEEAMTMRSNRARTLRSGKTTGVMVGGNLTVLTSMVGSDYMPDMRAKILLLEDVGESIYRIDRYMSTLQMAGILDQVAGVVFGHCTGCDPQKGYGGFTLMEVMAHYLKPLKVPSYYGAQFGHIKDNHILPVGIEAEMDADAGTVRLLEPAVT